MAPCMGMTAQHADQQLGGSSSQSTGSKHLWQMRIHCLVKQAGCMVKLHAADATTTFYV